MDGSSHFFKYSDGRGFERIGSLLAQTFFVGVKCLLTNEEACFYFIPVRGTGAGELRIFVPTLVDNPLDPGHPCCYRGPDCSCNHVREKLKEFFGSQVLVGLAGALDSDAVLQLCEYDQCADALGCAIGISGVRVQDVLHLEGYVLTRDFTCKLLELHMRRVARIPVVIEGESGVGKSRLLKTYTRLLM